MRETIFFTAEEYFASLFYDIEQAKKSIDVETYIFVYDKLGKQITKALSLAASKGVKVRILVDGSGTSLKWNKSLVKKLEILGIESRLFRPYPWFFWQWSMAKIKKIFFMKAIYLSLTINCRNHRKTCVIDNEIAYIGSFNISQVHLSKENGGEGWRDAGVRLQEAPLSNLSHAFEITWNHHLIKEKFKKTFSKTYINPIIRLNNSRRRRRSLYKNLLNKIRYSKRRIWITNAYFVPDNFLLRSLKIAAKNGVKIKILLPSKSDVLFMPWASATFYEQLLPANVRIFEYNNTVLHAKTLIIDDWMLVGSSNLNHRSLLHDLEADVNIQSKESKLSLEKQFLIDIKNSKEINLENWSRRSWYKRLMGQIMLTLKYWI